MTNSKPLASNIFRYLEADVRRNKREMGGFTIWKMSWNGFQNLDSLRFSHNVQVSKFGFFCGFPRFLGGPKNSQNVDFSAVSWYFEGRARPKILRGFPRWTGFKIWIFLQFPAIFRGPEKFLKRGFPHGFLGFWRMGLFKIIWNSDFPKFFSGFWRDGPTPKNCEPTNLSLDFSGF